MASNPFLAFVLMPSKVAQVNGLGHRWTYHTRDGKFFVNWPGFSSSPAPAVPAGYNCVGEPLFFSVPTHPITNEGGGLSMLFKDG